MENNVYYKHCDINDENISLHDCHATNIFYEHGVVSFVFKDGIWISNHHSNNSCNENVRSDIAEVKFSLEFENEYDITIYVFEEKFNKTYREEWKLSKLMEYINHKKCTLEFLYQYKGYQSSIFECWLWLDKKSYHKECELKISYKDVKYCWND